MKHKQSYRQAARDAKRSGYVDPGLLPIPRAKPGPFTPRTDRQRKYANAMSEVGSVTFGLGPAGTGKTYTAGCMGAQALQSGTVDRIILTRPAIEAGGEKMGYLPGEADEKFDPYFDPFREVLEERLGASFVELLIKDGRIKCEPFAYMRGKTFKNAFVILDEAQNATHEKFKLFLTRVGEGCIVVINGDQTQIDIKEESGLVDAANRVFHIPSVRVIRFQREDIVRSGFVQEVAQAYELPAPPLNPLLQ